MPKPASVPPRAVAAPAEEDESTLRFSALNLALLGLALAAILFGFSLMAGGSTVAAPLLLVLGYAVLVPAGLIV